MKLERQARQFVATLSRVLNGSITDGIRLRYIGNRGGSFGTIGYKIKDRDLVGSPIPVTIGRARPRCWLRINQQVTLEETGYLKTTKARVAVYADPEGGTSLLRYDFNRNAEGGYPPAHLQISAESKALRIMSEICDVNPLLERLHLPVGGVRFRPSLEDVVELLIVEGIASPRVGWEEALNRGRADFHQIQLKAAVRNDPDAAVIQLRSMGYVVTEPPPTSQS